VEYRNKEIQRKDIEEKSDAEPEDYSIDATSPPAQELFLKLGNLEAKAVKSTDSN
jgi:hypothetical protein